MQCMRIRISNNTSTNIHSVHIYNNRYIIVIHHILYLLTYVHKHIVQANNNMYIYSTHYTQHIHCLGVLVTIEEAVER